MNVNRKKDDLLELEDKLNQNKDLVGANSDKELAKEAKESEERIRGLKLTEKNEKTQIKIINNQEEPSKNEVELEFFIAGGIPEGKNAINYLRETKPEIMQKIELKKIKEVIVEKARFEELARIKIVYNKSKDKQTNESIENLNNSFLIEQEKRETPKQLVENPSPTSIKSNLKIVEEIPSKIKTSENTLDLVSKGDLDQSEQQLSLGKLKPILAEENALTDVDEKKIRKVSYSKLKFERNKKKSELFYKVKNHHELVKIGNNFYEDFKNGVKSFAFSSHKLEESQKKTILALASFFNNKENLRIAIVTPSVDHPIYKKLIQQHAKESMQVFPDWDYRFNYYTNGSFDFIEFKEFFAHKDLEEDFGYSDIIRSVVDGYDLIFWDTPDVKQLKDQSSFYFPLSMQFGQVTILVGLSQNKLEEIEEMKKVYDQYGIKVKGIILEKR